MTDIFLDVCENFKAQSIYCRRMESPFYADLLIKLKIVISRKKDSVIGIVLSNWQGNAKEDAVALRVVASLHYLVITAADKDLCAIFPPKLSLKDKDKIRALSNAIDKHEDFIIEFIKSPPQSNEVGRSIVLLAGFLEISKYVGSELDSFEIGASAGLNIAFDMYFYQTDIWQWGAPNSKVKIKSNWHGNAPSLGPINLHNRKACNTSPINAATQKNRLLSYVWPDQTQRLKRINSAIDYAAVTAPKTDRAEASKWLAQQHKLALVTPPTRPQVFYHSIIWQYFTKKQKHDFYTIMSKMSETASDTSPLVWMRLEPSDNNQYAELRVTIWPGKSEYHLADCGYHGEWVRWHVQ